MGNETRLGETYRLIVAIDRRLLLADERRYSRFEDAQAEVAGTVRRYHSLGKISAVALQRGRPSLVPRCNGNGGIHSTEDKCEDMLWTIEKRWGHDVVDRILSQNGFHSAPERHRRNGDRHRPGGNGHGAGHAQIRPRPEDTDPLPNAERHKTTRWHVISALTVILLSMLAIVFIQTGGHPTRVIAALWHPQPTIKEELPFDARTSFVADAPAPETPATTQPNGS